MKRASPYRSPLETDASRRAVLSAQARSGLSVSDFAATRGLSPATLYAWRRRLGLTRRRSGPRLVEVSITGSVPSPARPGLVLHLFGRHRLELPSDFSEDAVRRLARALSAC